MFCPLLIRRLPAGMSAAILAGMPATMKIHTACRQVQQGCLVERNSKIRCLLVTQPPNKIATNKMCDASRPESIACPHKLESDYQVGVLKDDYEELEENNRLLQKELKSRTRQHEQLKRDYKELEQELAIQKVQFDAKLKLQDEETVKVTNQLEQLQEELERHKKLLEESEKARLEVVNQQIPVADEIALARETNKQTREYHYKWKMAEQENSVLQTAVSRLENQVARYKESLKDAETVEGDLKAEKRRLLRELRESQAKAEELQSNNSLLQMRLDRLKSRNLLGADATASTTTSMTQNTSLNQLPTSGGTTSTGTPATSTATSTENNSTK